MLKARLRFCSANQEVNWREAVISKEGAVVEGVAELGKFPACAPMSGASLIVRGSSLAAKPLGFDCIASVMNSLLFVRKCAKKS